MKSRASLFLLSAYFLSGLSCYGQEGLDSPFPRGNDRWKVGSTPGLSSQFIMEVRRPWGRLPWEEDSLPEQDQDTGPGPPGWENQTPNEPAEWAANRQKMPPRPRQPWSFGSLPQRELDDSSWFQDDIDDSLPRSTDSWPTEPPVYPGSRYSDIGVYRERYYDRPPVNPLAHRYWNYYGYLDGWEFGHVEPHPYGGPGGRWEPGYYRDRYYNWPAVEPGLYRYGDYYSYPWPWYPEPRFYDSPGGWEPWYPPDGYHFDGLLGEPWGYGSWDYYGP